MSAAEIHIGPLIAILAMTAATYLMRTGGYLAMARVPLTPWVQRMLDALPGCVITATIVPVLARSGSPALLGVAAVVAVMAWSRNEFLAIAVGMGTVMAVRAFGL
ncbi:MAG: AzlD domain-containing protein [Rhizobiales bacterium]|jgi:uncharacterized membrane protein|nr:AzlD domain-containing protein [Hyphomicrobiales bacterium]